MVTLELVLYRDQPIMLLFLPIMLCCSAFTYYAQELEFLSDYYAFVYNFA